MIIKLKKRPGPKGAVDPVKKRDGMRNCRIIFSTNNLSIPFVIICYNIVAFRVVAMQRPRYRRRYRRSIWATVRKHVPAATDRNATIEGRYFLCGPCRDVISKGQN
jgi:hypothetical protein